MKTFTKEQLESAKNALVQLSEEESESSSSTKMLEILKPELMKARKAGKSYKEIAAVLKEADIDVSRTLISNTINKTTKTKMKKSA